MNKLALICMLKLKERPTNTVTYTNQLTAWQVSKKDNVKSTLMLVFIHAGRESNVKNKVYNTHTSFIFQHYEIFGWNFLFPGI